MLLFLPLLWWHILFWTQLLWHILMCHQNAQPLIQYFSGFCSAPELLHTTLSLAQLLFPTLQFISHIAPLSAYHAALHIGLHGFLRLSAEAPFPPTLICTAHTPPICNLFHTHCSPGIICEIVWRHCAPKAENLGNHFEAARW